MPRTAHQIVLDKLNGPSWHAPHEVRGALVMQCHYLSESATTARMRDIRKPQYGGHNLVKRIRKGTDYYEYRIERQEERAA